MKRQRGGTVVGFIIGLLVGLGAALAVAVYVTKVPVPFLHKGQNRTAEHDAAETRKNKDWDPNAPLYGKNPARPAAPAASDPVGSESPGTAPAPPPANAAAKPVLAPPPPAKAEVKPETRPAISADPLGDLARAKATGVDPFTYFVQVGAFRSAEEAESQRAKLSLMGVETKVTEREQSGRTVFRVRAGPFEKKEDADKIKDRLDASGMETALVRVQR